MVRFYQWNKTSVIDWKKEVAPHYPNFFNILNGEGFWGRVYFSSGAVLLLGVLFTIGNLYLVLSIAVFLLCSPSIGYKYRKKEPEWVRIGPHGLAKMLPNAPQKFLDELEVRMRELLQQNPCAQFEFEVLQPKANHEIQPFLIVWFYPELFTDAQETIVGVYEKNTFVDPADVVLATAAP